MDKKRLMKKVKYALRFLPDEVYIQLYYFLKFKKLCDLKNPQTFSEKIQWLKLNDRKSEYTKIVDKYEAKKYVASIIGEEYIIPILGIWDNFDEINFDTLPEQFVLKCTHDSEGLVIVQDKSKLDIAQTRKKIKEALKYNFYYIGREWPYKNIKPRIIAEKYIVDKAHYVPEDYKVYCFNGKAKYIVVYHNRYDNTKQLSETVYDTNWISQGISFNAHYAVSDDVEPEPECLKQMLYFAELLSKNIAQSRIDFYIVDKAIKFGEITLYMGSGFQSMIPEELDEVMGRLVKLQGVSERV